MQTLKISPSILENYRTCYYGKFGKTLQDFVTGLDQPWEKTEAQSKGDAYHKLLELGGKEFHKIENGQMLYVVPEPQFGKDWVFTHDQAAPALETFTKYPCKQHEVWGRLNLEIMDYSIGMSLRVDALEKPTIWDYKTTGKPPRVENYADAVQWPLYMMAYPDCTMFRYRVFHLTDQGCKYQDFIFEKSEAREQYAINWLTMLVAFIRDNGLNPNLLTTQTATMNLFQIELQQREIVDELIENGGALSPELDAKMAITREMFESKAQSYALLIKEIDLDIDQIDQVIHQFKRKKETLENSKDQLKNRLLSAMLAFDIQKFKNQMVSIWVQTSEKLKIMNEQAIPAEFLNEVVTVKVDAKGLKDALKAGTIETDAAYISVEPNLQVR